MIHSFFILKKYIKHRTSKLCSLCFKKLLSKIVLKNINQIDPKTLLLFASKNLTLRPFFFWAFRKFHGAKENELYWKTV